MSRPNLPIITLRRGPWVAELFDPRPAPALLGARFIHGGWIVSLRRDGRELLGGADRNWLNFDGVGMPETFESGLGWSNVAMHEEFLRPGCGRLIKENNDSSERHASNARLSAILEWEIEATEDSVTFRTRDGIKANRIERLGYQLERTVRLIDDGLVSSTTFELDAVPLQTVPITWFAHPFLAQRRFDETAFEFPAGTKRLDNPPWFRGMTPPSAVQDGEGRWRIEKNGSRAVFAGVWGSREPIMMHLAGGGALRLEPGFPLDHLVLWASDHGASIEPKWARTWSHGERVTWDITYRWV